jgi:hypothetical protein
VRCRIDKINFFEESINHCGDGIPIGAFNVPRGSVVVTAGGRILVEGLIIV